MRFRRKKVAQQKPEEKKSKHEKTERQQRRGIWPLSRRSAKQPTTVLVPTRDEVSVRSNAARSQPQAKVVYQEFGDDPRALLTVLKSEGAVPTKISATEVLIKVQASTVTHNDIILRRGMDPGLNSCIHLPATPGYDVVGRIVARGSQVEPNWTTGQRVAALVRLGGNARYVTVPASSLVKVPMSVDSAEAACMVSIYMCAYQGFKKALAHVIRDEERTDFDDYLLKGKKVLVTGAFGPIARSFIQLCQNTGATVFATAPKYRHQEVRQELHASPLPPLAKDWLQVVKGKMDIVFDGQCQDSFESPRAALNTKGILVCVGMHGLMNTEEANFLCGAPMSAILASANASWFMSKTEMYDVWSSFQNDPAQFKSDLKHVFGMLKRRESSVCIDRLVTLKDVADAHGYIEQGKANGAVVCLPWEEQGKVKLRIFETKSEAPATTHMGEAEKKEEEGEEEEDEFGEEEVEESVDDRDDYDSYAEEETATSSQGSTTSDSTSKESAVRPSARL